MGTLGCPVKFRAATAAAKRPPSQGPLEEGPETFSVGAAYISRSAFGTLQFSPGNFAIGVHANKRLPLTLVIFRDPGYNTKLEAVIRDLLQHMGLSAASRRAGFILAFAVILVYGWMAVRGPQGLQALLEKHREIRQLEEQNAATARENERRKQRIQRLQTSTSEQEMEIRKQLKLLRPGETTFILPDAPKENAAPAEAPTQP